MSMIKKLNKLTILAIITAVMVILMLITIQQPSTTGDDDALLFLHADTFIAIVNKIGIYEERTWDEQKNERVNSSWVSLYSG